MIKITGSLDWRHSEQYFLIVDLLSRVCLTECYEKNLIGIISFPAKL